VVQEEAERLVGLAVMEALVVVVLEELLLQELLLEELERLDKEAMVGLVLLQLDLDV
jgi:hypothetical protein